MDIVGAIRSAPLVDLILFFGLFACFILGMLQGAVRRIIGIASILVAFLLAANLRQPFGDYLADNWKQFPVGYNHLLAFGIAFSVLAVVASIVTQGFYKRTDLYASRPIVDDLIGGVLGVVEGFVLLVIAVVIFNSYSIDKPYGGDLDGIVRQAQDMLIHQSHIAGAVRDHFVPAFIGVLSPLLPSQIVSLFP